MLQHTYLNRLIHKILNYPIQNFQRNIEWHSKILNLLSK